jgi:periplasmic protein CpxP/Spy
MKINKIFTIVFAVTAFVVSANTIFSQDFKFKKTPEERAQHRAEKMQKNLSLTDDQYKQVYSALLSQAQQMKDLKASKETDKTARKEKMKTIWQNTDATISGILNSEQQTKYQQMKEKRKEKHKQKKGMKKHKKDKKHE